MEASAQQRLDEAYRNLDAGNHAAALRELSDLSEQITDPWESAALLYHEALFHLRMNETGTARQTLEKFKKKLTFLGLPADSDEDDLPHNLAVMVGYTEVEVSLAENREEHALRVIAKLFADYPRQLSIAGFRETSDEIKTHRAFLLANCGRWAEAKLILEHVPCPPDWKNVRLYYLGHCYYELKEYGRGKACLVEALNLNLPPDWEQKARYVLGLVEYHLGNFKAANDQFKLYLSVANPECLQESKIWDWLEATSRALGNLNEAEEYRKMRSGDTNSRLN